MPLRVDLAPLPWRVSATRFNPPGLIAQAPLPTHVTFPAHLPCGLPLTLPGCAHTALLAAGLIADPRIHDNESDQQWIGHTDWRFELNFPADSPLLRRENITLHLEGLDAPATISLNDAPLASSRSAFLPFAQSVKHLLRQGDNRLTIDFQAPITFARSEQARLGHLPATGDWEPFNFIRKPACNFGWDWGPRVATCGIWNGAFLDAWNGTRLTTVTSSARQSARGIQPADETQSVSGKWIVTITAFHTPHPPQASALLNHLHLHAQLTPGAQSESCCTLHPDSVTLRPIAYASTPAGESVTSIEIEVQEPALWWPRRYGPAPLYNLHIWLGERSHTIPPIADNFTCVAHAIAFRTISLNTSSAQSPPPQIEATATTVLPAFFTLNVNQHPIFCLGANRIPPLLLPGLPPLHPPAPTPPPPPPDPADPFASLPLLIPRPPDDISFALDAGMNMLRISGTGNYESSDFFTRADALGLLILHDFMFAGAIYPEQEIHLLEQELPLIQQEARHHILRLARHPSLVLWCGGNQFLTAHADCDFAPAIPPDHPYDHTSFHILLPQLVAKLDPSRPYWPYTSTNTSTNSLASSNASPANDRHTGDVHFRSAASVVPRFLTAFGHQAPPAVKTLRSALAEEHLHLWSGPLSRRQRGSGGNLHQFDNQLKDEFTPPHSFPQWHYQSQLTQARAITAHLAAARSNAPYSAGVLVRQLNDVWPALTWSLIDDALRPKPALAAFAVAAQPKAILFTGPAPHRNQTFPAIVAINDSDEPWPLSARTSTHWFDSPPLTDEHHNITIQPRSVLLLSCGPHLLPANAHYVQTCDALGAPLLIHTLGTDLLLPYPPPRFSLTPQGLVAASFIANLAPSPDLFQAAHFLTLRPGDIFDLAYFGPDFQTSTLALPDAIIDHTGLLRKDHWLCSNWFSQASGAH